MIDTVFQIVILVMSVVVHEVSHGYAAKALGDRTAEYQGRLTLNPVPHIDIWGSIVIPLLLLMYDSGFIIGWAKPVLYNPYNLKNQRWGEAIVAVAGPVSNLLLAIIFGLLIRFGLIPVSAMPIVVSIVVVNLVLGIFNLMPIPPLDGSKILFSILPAHLIQLREQLERYGLVLALIFILFIWKYISPVVIWIFSLIVGVSV
jgi:Zn-dependent protease